MRLFNVARRKKSKSEFINLALLDYDTRAAHRGRSKREYAAKIGIVLEEADESLFWLEVMEEGALCPEELEADLQKLKQEAGELTAIFATIHRKYRS